MHCILYAAFYLLQRFLCHDIPGKPCDGVQRDRKTHIQVHIRRTDILDHPFTRNTYAGDGRAGLLRGGQDAVELFIFKKICQTAIYHRFWIVEIFTQGVSSACAHRRYYDNLLPD